MAGEEEEEEDDDDNVVILVVVGTAGEEKKVDALIGPGEEDGEELSALLLEDDTLATLDEAEEELAALLIEADVEVPRLDKLDVIVESDE